VKTPSMIRERYQGYLEPGKKYRVTQPFLDARKAVHRVGEIWTFVGYIPNGFGETTNLFIEHESGVQTAFGIEWGCPQNSLGPENLRDFIEEAS